MIQEKLKKDTRPDHDRLEELLFVHSIMDGTLSLPEYKKILTTNYLIHTTFEEPLFRALSPQLAEELKIHSRRKLPALLSDLREVDMEAPYAGSVEQPDVAYDNDPALLGALYVLEGATLGGHVIVKKLAVNSMLNHLNLGFHYYRVYGDDLIANWKEFCGILNQQPETDYPSILAGAKKMFEEISSLAVSS